MEVSSGQSFIPKNLGHVDEERIPPARGYHNLNKKLPAASTEKRSNDTKENLLKMYNNYSNWLEKTDIFSVSFRNSNRKKKFSSLARRYAVAPPSVNRKRQRKSP
ncbi:hypothetical protein TNCV_3541571 [Trichonephila clavipes]|nr:hypothetical protein TNCV_3541571 [Trichonephila clavipes]